MPNISNQDKSHSSMRHGEDSGKEHLTKDGQPDHRYKENREDSGENSKDQRSNNQNNGSSDRQSNNQSDDSKNQRSNNQNDDDDESSKLADIPTKADGTADMRYSESREAVASGLIEKDEVIEDALNGDQHHGQQGQSSHQKSDGTEDKRYKENRDEE